jgi:hypothetical protein
MTARFSCPLIFPAQVSDRLAAYAIGGVAKLNSLNFYPLNADRIGYLKMNANSPRP